MSVKKWNKKEKDSKKEERIKRASAVTAQQGVCVFSADTITDALVKQFTQCIKVYYHGGICCVHPRWIA